MSELLDVAELHAAVLDAARIYLRSGPAPRRELIRVVAQHLEVPGPQAQTHLSQHARDGALAAAGDLMSLPAGGDTRDTEGER